MKSINSGYQRRFHAARLVFCVLLIITMTGGVARPVQACGIITHTEIVELAIDTFNEQAYPELADLLEDYEEYVNYGAMFPDWVFTMGSSDETAHDTRYYDTHPFRDALTAQLLPIFRRNPQSEDDRRAIAFLFGLISHQEADNAWHFPQPGENQLPLGLEPQAAQNGWPSVEFDADILLLDFDSGPEFYLSLDLKDAILAAYSTNGKTVSADELETGKGRQEIQYIGEVTIAGLTSPIRFIIEQAIPYELSQAIEFLETYYPGGINHDAYLTQIAWQETWNWLNTYTPVTTIELSPAQPDGNHGWYRQPVTITLEGTDNFNKKIPTGPFVTWYSLDGGIIYQQYTEPITISTEGIHQISYYTADSMGISEEAQSLTLQIDWTPPSIIGEPTTIPNANGWYNTPVTVHFTAEDTLSGLDTLTPDQTLTTEGAGQSVIGIAVDKAGNSASFTVEPINIDLTPPLVDVSVDQPRYTRTEPFVVHFSGSDAVSGLTSLTAEFNDQPVTDGQTVDLFGLPLGTYTLAARGEDLAGWATETSQSIELYASIESLQGTVDRLCQEKSITKSGTCRELSAKLEAVFAAMDRGNFKVAANVLKAFQNSVRSQTDKAITDEAAGLLLMDSDYVIVDLNR